MKNLNKVIALVLVVSVIACITLTSGCSKAEEDEVVEKETIVTSEVTIEEKGLLVKKGEDGNWYAYYNDIIAEDYTGVVKKDGTDEWYYVKDGKVDFTYTGYADNMYGTWYIKDGKVDSDYSGEKVTEENGKEVSVKVKDGKVTEKDGEAPTVKESTTYVATVTKVEKVTEKKKNNNTKKTSSTKASTTKRASQTASTTKSTASTGKTNNNSTTKKTTSTTKKNTTTKKTTSTTKKTTTATPTVDIEYYKNYAINYAKSLGMTYDSSVVCWTTPPVISPYRSDANMKRNIREYLDDVTENCGAKYYNIWYEPYTYDGHPNEYELVISWG